MSTRRTVRVVGVVVAAVLAVVLVSSAAVVGITVSRPVPDRDGDARLPGLVADVEVVRDRQGVPHIFADTAEDLFAAQGYVDAQDRFLDMDLRRRTGAGTLAALLGPDERAVRSDVLARTLGWQRTAEAELSVLDARTVRYLRAYSDGVNAYLSGRSPGQLSLAYPVLDLQAPVPDVQPWSPVDSLVWLKASAWDARSNYAEELGRGLLVARGETPSRVRQLYPGYPDASPVILPDELLGVGEPVLGSPTPRLAGRDAGTVRVSRGEQAAAQVAAGPIGAVPIGAVPIGAVPIGAVPAMAATLEALSAASEGLAANPSGLGSNAWVVSGEHTSTGAPMLAADPHLRADSPSALRQVGLHCRTTTTSCPFDVSGLAQPGVPGVLMGQNDAVAWALTALEADHTDLYLERVTGGEYELDDETVPLDVREESIEVAGAQTISMRVRSTGNGPLLSDVLEVVDGLGRSYPAPVGSPSLPGGYEVSIRWAGAEPSRTLDGLLAMNAAGSRDGLLAGASLLEVPGYDVVFAEAGPDGGIGYAATGRVPVRGSSDGTVPAPGWLSAYAWQGYLPAEQLPLVVEPSRGWLAVADNRVTEPRSGPELGADSDYGYRARRVEAGLLDLVDAGDVTVEQMVELQTDDVDPFAATLLPYLLDVGGLDAFTLEAVDLLRDWDGSQPTDSAAAVYYNAVWAKVLERTFHDELQPELQPDGGDRWYAVVESLLRSPDDPFWDDVATVNLVESRDQVLQQALVDARLDLTRSLAKDPGQWSWGRLHTVSPGQPWLDDAVVPGPVASAFTLDRRGVAGGPGAVAATSWDASTGEYATTTVPAARLVMDLDDPDLSRWVVLSGVSGHPFDSYHGNQYGRWLAGETFPWAVSADAVEEVARERLLLRP